MSRDRIEFSLACRGDAPRLAAMSRDLVEEGLGWSWVPSRVVWHVRAPDSVVLVARQSSRIAGFAIMRFAIEHAHLDLLAVEPAYRRAGVGRRLIGWLEESALVAGISIIYLEVRAANDGARCFYERLGYRSIKHLPGYYDGRESAVRMARDLWCTTPTDAT